jgi:hypothetical protein
MLRAVLRLTSLVLPREGDGCFCSAQPGVPTQAMLLGSQSGTQVRSDDRIPVRPTSTLLHGYIARMVQCLASRLVASGCRSKLKCTATADASAATHHCHRLASVPARPREEEKEHLLKVQNSPMRQGEVASSYFSAPRTANLACRNITFLSEHVGARQAPVVLSFMQRIPLSILADMEFCVLGARCKCSWQGESDVLEGCTASTTMFCMAPGKSQESSLSLGFSRTRNRGSCTTCSEDGKANLTNDISTSST